MSKASRELQAWVERAEALPKGRAISAARARDIAAGFGALDAREQSRFLAVLHERATTARSELVRALGTTKDTRALADRVRWVWEERVFDRVGVGVRFVELALVRGRGAEAAAVVTKLWSFTSYPGLAPRLASVIAEYPLDDELLTLAARALLSASATAHNPMERWGLAAYLLRTGEHRHLEAIAAAGYGFLSVDARSSATGLAERLCDVIDEHGRTSAAADLSAHLRAVIAGFPK